tara:strand:- start:368 stop:1297 length:930 start_codon:yes stop_codon:yes gene_type:complete
MSRPLRIAIAGLGKIARDQHMPAIAGNPDFQLAAIISSTAQDEAVPVFRTLEDVLASGLHLDAIAICTPPQVRHALCDLASANGLAVLLEKPPATTVEEARALAAMGQDRGTTVFAGWHSRFAPFVADARVWCENHGVLHGQIDWHEDPAKWHPGQAWLWQNGGLGVFDPGINALSILTAIRPGAWCLWGARFEQPENAETPSAARFSLGRNEDRVEVSLSFAAGDTETWSIRLEAGNGETLHLLDGGTALSLNGGVAARRPNAEYAGIYKRFAGLIAAGQSEVDVVPLDLVEAAFLTADITPVGPVAV